MTVSARSLRSRCTYCQSRSRDWASSPTVGSSRKRMREWWMSARAISSRRFMPDDKRAHQPLPPVGELDQRQHLVDALAPQCCRHAIDEAVEVQVLVEGEPVVEARLLEHDANVAAAFHRILDDIDAVDAAPSRCPAAGWCRGCAARSFCRRRWDRAARTARPAAPRSSHCRAPACGHSAWSRLRS